MIRYDNKLNNEIRRIVNNYNAKIRRLQNGAESDDYIAPKLGKSDLDEIKASSRTRKDLRRRLSEYQEYSKQGGEQIVDFRGAEMPRYQANIIKKYQANLKRNITRERNYLESVGYTTAGVEDVYSISQQFDENVRRLNSLEDILKRDIAGIGDIGGYIRTLRGNLRSVNNSQWQKNFASMILDSSYLAGISHSRVHAVYEKLMQLSPKKFAELSKRERLIKNIIFYYKGINELGIDVSSENFNDEIITNFNELESNLDVILNDYK